MSPPIAEPMDAFRGDRTYLGADHRRNERRTWIVATICLILLAAQISGGLAFGSMALVANGLHMAAHVAVLVVAALAYGLARSFANDPRFAFGTGKIGYLAGFANAAVLALTALLVVLESLHRLIAPEPVAYEGAMGLAAGVLAISLLCVWLLRPGPASETDEDLNLSAAHLHLAGDAGVSLLALMGLAAGRYLGWTWADPVAGMLGAGLLGHFSWRLLRRAGAVLLDLNPSPKLTAEIRARLEQEGDQVVDLHLWRLGPGHHAAIVVVGTLEPAPVEAYHARLDGMGGLRHVTIEVRQRRGA